MLGTLLAHGDWGGLIFAVLLVIAVVAAACVLVVAMSWWLTSKVHGSMGLFWGSLLGVGTVHLIEMVFRNWSLHDVYESLLPSAAAASALACLLNLLNRNRRGSESKDPSDGRSPPGS